MRIESIDLAGNNIESIDPSWIKKQTERGLQIFNLDGNPLSSVSPGIGADLVPPA